jgi:RNA ligase
MNEPQVVDFHKIKSPFIRKTNEKGEYVVTPDLEPGYEWIFEDGVRAVDKLHGTNICVHFHNGKIIAIDNRSTRILQIPFEISGKNQGNKSRFLLGVLNSVERGWLESFQEGRVYGELIAPEINTNLHETPYPLFVPFSYLYDRCHWKSWVNNKYPKNFNAISEWFKNINSLFTERVFKKSVMAEGLVFWHPDGRQAKLRRDMFDWYVGSRHGD